MKKMMNNMDFSNYNKAAIFTDLHMGRKNSSEIHNKDCYEYIKWFVEQTKKNEADHVIFMGDWFENRDAITGKTLDWSHKCMKYLRDNLDMPIFFIIGNHDLVYRNTRNAFNTQIFEPFQNLIIVDDNISVNIGGKSCLFCPYLFEEEYPDQIKNINSHDVVFGHFEFKGFVVTGETKKLDHGPDAEDFKQPDRIFTGHFHKRQISGNVHYIGSTFPMDYADANDTERGMAIYEYANDNLRFIDWEDAPTYIYCKFSDMVKKPKKVLRKNATVKSLVDTSEFGYEDLLEIKYHLMEKYSLRELRLEEPLEDYKISEDVNEEDLEGKTTQEIVLNLLDRVHSEKIDPEKLKKEYKEL
jgi:DNA repair exonuclease SbcCD nuclease subunit